MKLLFTRHRLELRDTEEAYRFSHRALWPCPNSAIQLRRVEYQKCLMTIVEIARTCSLNSFARFGATKDGDVNPKLLEDIFEPLR